MNVTPVTKSKSLTCPLAPTDEEIIEAIEFQASPEDDDWDGYEDYHNN